ncbi:cyclopropane mycolic acid synthase family methyltransferase [Mycobacterium sp. 21AC1]|uniref:cyclopropane mycolic acid synthase family methyltransferase n=1 Tax=[Mycobacterium] appelbergii TaxID=2939269 RepID=UPI0029394397|nr:cyclopropane mycolic acid synthase family methyltransferase [Mycobacterium sp. 21AC1]MDV3125312.1 cyclopropane mycolic acid synthase family methyltransferase [Mycobacterium sp. 21AC1]
MAVTTETAPMQPHFEEVQAHYDLSDDFFALFQDPSRTYSCAFYEYDDMPLEQAQFAKIDLALDKLGLQPGMTLLDVGCGWGALMKRAVEKYDVNVIGLTLSRNQYAYTRGLLEKIETDRSHLVHLMGWEQFDDPVDRIVSIEAFEAFGKSRYAAFFDTAHRVMPPDGRMVVETIFTHPIDYWREHGIPITLSDMKFTRFLGKEIFPGGQLPSDDDMREFSSGSGFSTDEPQLMNEHYVRTLDTWSASLADHRDEAIAITSAEVYDRYMHYLTGCADFFRRGLAEVAQFTFTKRAQ